MSDKTARVLIIEDDDDTRANLCDILEMFGFETLTARSGSEALALPGDSSIDVILLDRQLGDTMADQLLPRLRELLPDADVIIATGHADLESTIGALRQGAADYLLKPVNPDLLRVSIERCLDRRRLHDEKLRSEAAFRKLVESAGSLILILRPDGTVAWINPFGEQFIARPQCEVLGKDCFETFLSHQDARPWRTLFRRVNRGAIVPEFEIEVDCGHGIRHWLVCNARQLDDYEGDSAVLVIGQDITARRFAEQRLLLLDAAISDLEEGVLIAHAGDSWFRSRIEYANQAVTRICGHTIQEIIGHSPRLFGGAETDDRLLERIDRSLAAGEPITVETSFSHPDGRSMPVELHLSPVCDAAGKRTHTVATVRDIALRKLHEEQLLQSERLAAIGKAMTGLAHESRNALQRSQASLDLLGSELEENALAMKLIDRIRVAQDDLHRLYEDVREYARPIVVNPLMQRIDAVLHEAWDEMLVKRDGRRTKLIEVAQTDDLMCPIESFLIRQVFRNVIDNSLAACLDPVEVTVIYSDAILPGGPALMISLRDNGPGMSAESQTRVLDEFFTTKTHGTGLGLAIVKRLVGAHRGMLTVPDVESGFEVQILLPRSV